MQILFIRTKPNHENYIYAEESQNNRPRVEYYKKDMAQ